MQAIFPASLCRFSTFVVLAAFMVGCSLEGDGPERIMGTPAPPPPEIPPGFCDDLNFEDVCGPYTFSDFAGGVAQIVDNPDASGLNTTEKVVQMRKFSGEIFGGSTLQLDDGVDFSEGQAFTMKVWSPRAVPVLFKLEGLDEERSREHSGSGEWEELCFEFTGATTGPDVTGITFIFDLGVMGNANTDPANWTFYFDEITQVANCGEASAPTALPVDFEGAGPYVFNDFEGAVADVVANPDSSSINTSAQVARMRKFAGEVFAGSTLALDEAVNLASGTAFTMKVWSPRPVPVLFKLEGVDAERSVSHGGGSAWQELCFDFSGIATGVPAPGITFIFDLGAAGNAAADPDNWTFYFDDIRQVASCDGDNGGGEVGAGIIPDVVLYATDPAVTIDLVFGEDYTALTPFGSGSVFNGNNTSDPDFNPAFSVTTGTGYGPNIGQLAFVGFDAGFAAGYGTLDFKVKGMSNDLIRVKFLEAGDYLDVNLATANVSTALDNGWFQVSIPLASMTGVATATALLFETDDASPTEFTFLLTDIGFSGTAGDEPPPGDGVGIDFDGPGPFTFSDFEGGVATVVDNPAP
ncbi:MAG: hypothetical protein ACNA8J_08155, partial [Gammaproteobacteria bacterium]